MEVFIEPGLQIFVNTLTLKKKWSKNWVTQLKLVSSGYQFKMKVFELYKMWRNYLSSVILMHFMWVKYYLDYFERKTLFLFSYCQKEPFQSSVWCFSWFLHMKMCHIWSFCIDHLDLRGNSVSVGLVREKTAHTVLSQYLVVASRQTFSIRWLCIMDLRTVLGF